ncbi:MAG: DUF1684 domain-containing protein [Hyphomicrobiales bacterium]|nr:DUF1684 domain-containing protein [Hyphomicrobiales bacterium]
MVSGSYAAALVEWREIIGQIYREIRATHEADPRRAWERFRERRDSLYKHHSCSALTEAEKLQFDGFPNYAYDPVFCFVGEIEYTASENVYTSRISEAELPYRKIAVAKFGYFGKTYALDVYWLDIYGGGIWIPVGDETNGETTYPGGRYLFDTCKGANLGMGEDGGNILLDMNFLYPPSCSLNDRWICPLCPPENKLPFRVEAGEVNLMPHVPPTSFLQADEA